VTEQEAGERIDRVLSARDLGYSRSALQAFIADGRVEVDGQVVRASARAAAGARVALRPAPPPASAALPQDIPLDVRFEDTHLLVVHKPAGMVVHPAPGHPDGTLVNALRFALGPGGPGDPERPGIVHRLDRDTSGLMVVAKSEAAREGLVGLFSRHDIERAYLAIALGHLAGAVRYDTFHGRHPVDRKRFTSRLDRGKRAITEVRALERLHAATLIECQLHTGRTHQIRVHLSEHGHPLLGDPIYGRRLRDPRLLDAAATAGRLALHARLLGFRHPVTGEQLRFEAPLPDELQRAVAGLR